MNKVKTIIRSSPFIITLIYVIIGSIWIQFSDQWVLSVFDDPESITQVQSYKGWFFVSASGLLIFSLIRKSNNILESHINDLQLSRNKFKATFEHAPIGIVHHRPDEKWLEVNQTLCNILGYKKEELTSLNFDDFIHPDHIEEGRRLDNQLIEGQLKSFTVEKQYIRKDGSIFPGRTRKTAVFSEKDNSLYIIGTLEDVSGQKEYENKINKSLKEKEILLSEVHHRVKNNLALISALFDIQGMYTDDKRVHSVFDKSKLRIKCLAMIHETFSESDDTAAINFCSHLEHLIDYLSTALKPERFGITVKKNISPTTLNINLAIPVSLICNEVLMNIDPRRFRHSENPVITISLFEQDDMITLSITDNGKLVDKNQDLDKPETASSTIIKTLVSQVGGNLEVESNDECYVMTLTFKKRDKKGTGSHMAQI